MVLAALVRPRAGSRKPKLRRILPPTVDGGERVTLNRQQLDELVRVSKQPVLTSTQESELQEICSNHLIWTRFENASSPALAATEIHSDLEEQLKHLVNSIAQIVGHDTPQHHHVHSGIDEELEHISPDGTCSADQALKQIMALQRGARRAQKKHKLLFGGRGHLLTNEALRMFIWSLADFFESIGGNSTAPFQGMLYKPDSPFARWVAQLNKYLPTGVRAKGTVIPDLVREVCRVRRHMRRPRR